MIDAPSSTWFSTAPHWRWYIVLYFFFGGLAGGCYFVAALIDWFGRPEDRPLARLGYYIAFPLVILCGLLLTIDLGRPERFWHMLIQRNTFEPMFKWWSPISFGSWILSAFGLFSFLAFLAALAEEDRPWPVVRRLRRLRLPWNMLRQLRPPTPIGDVISVIGGLSGYFLTGYTGMLLAVTNRPIWSDTPLLGMLFIASAASTSVALLILLASRWRWTMPGIHNLRRMDDWLIVLELVVLIAVVVSLGPVLRAWFNAWGLLLLFIVAAGLLAPLVLSLREDAHRSANVLAATVLVLMGGFLLRAMIVLSSEAV